MPSALTNWTVPLFKSFDSNYNNTKTGPSAVLTENCLISPEVDIVVNANLLPSDLNAASIKSVASR